MVSRVAEFAGALVIILIGFTAVCALTNDPANRSMSERGPVHHSSLGVLTSAFEDGYTAKAALGQFPLPLPDESEEQAKADLVLAIQFELSARGFVTGPADGVMRPETREAIRDYQTEFGLDVTGEPTVLVLDHIRMTRMLGPAVDSPDQADRRELVLRVQKRLADLGYDTGAANGVVDGQTRQAIAAFERDLGLPVTGDLTPELVRNLGTGPLVLPF